MPGWDVPKSGNWIHNQIRDPKLFKSLRTKTLSGVKGVQIRGGQLKEGAGGWKTEGVLFSKKEWTLETAKAWFSKHKSQFDAVSLEIHVESFDAGLRLEQLEGGIRARVEAIGEAGRSKVFEFLGIDPNEGYAYLEDAFDDYAVFCFSVYGDPEKGREAERGYLAIDYSLTESDGSYSITFSNPRKVKVSRVVTEEPQGDSGQGTADMPMADPGTGTVVMDKMEAKAADGEEGEKLFVESIAGYKPPEANEVLELLSEPKPGQPEIAFWARPIKLEAVRATEKGPVDRIRGEVPLLIIGKKTIHDVVYTTDCAKHLYSDLTALLESTADTWNEEGPWPVGAMYLSHSDRLNTAGGFNNLSDIAARITGVFVVGGKSIDQIADGDMLGIRFESLSTSKGRDLVALVTETKFVKGVSHAAFVKESASKILDGVEYVGRIRAAAGFGADFCDRPANAYERPSQAALRLESKGGEDEGRGTMPFDMEQLKKDNPEAAAMILRLETEAQRGKLESAAGLILDGYRDKVKKAENTALLPESAVEALMESTRGRIGTAVADVAKERPSLALDTQDFRDAVISKVDPHFESEKSRFQKFAADAAAQALKAAGVEGLPSGLKPEGDPGGNGKPRFSAYINTLPYEALLLESDNERVGLPRGQKNADGSIKACRVTDVVLSRACGDRPVYVESPYGGMIHVLDLHHPGLRDKIAAVSKVYMEQPFMTDMAGKGHNDVAIRRNAAFIKANQKMSLGMKLEADEMLTSDVLGTLHPDIRQGLLEYLFATAIFPQIAQIVPCQSSAYKVFYKDYKRKAEHKFGSIAQGGAFSAAGDEGALSVPDRCFLKVTTLTATEGTITVEYTNENGVTGRTTDVTVPDASAVGTFIEIYPAAVGEQIMDITGATAAGWSAGAVDLLAREAITAGTELTVSGKATTELNYKQGTVEEMDLQVDLSWRTIEDANISLANVGPGRVDIAAEVLRDLGGDFADFIDRRGLAKLNDATDFLAGNTVGHDITTVPAGYTLKEWKAELLDKGYQLASLLGVRGHLRPEIALINEGDRHKYTWIGEKFAGQPASRQDFFLNGMGDWPRFAGTTPYISEHQNHGRILMVNRSVIFFPVYIPLQIRGPLFDGDKADNYIARSRSIQLVMRPETRGYVEITE